MFPCITKILSEKKFDTNKGAEGGFAPTLKAAHQALTLLIQAIKKARYTAGVNKGVAIALVPAASEVYDCKRRTYVLEKAIKAKNISNEKGTLTSAKIAQYWQASVKKFPIISPEDALAGNACDGFDELNRNIGKSGQTVGVVL